MDNGNWWINGTNCECQLLGENRKKSIEIIEMLNTVYGDNALKKTTMSKWFNNFNEGCEGCKDNVRLRLPFISCGDKNIELVVVPCTFWTINDCPDDRWWAEYYKIFCAHTIDYRITTEKVCAKRRISIV